MDFDFFTKPENVATFNAMKTALADFDNSVVKALKAVDIDGVNLLTVLRLIPNPIIQFVLRLTDLKIAPEDGYTSM